MRYEEFLEAKIMDVTRSGFDVSPEELHPRNLPHQRDTIIWAANLGRALIASSFGLGKTQIECELARLIHKRTGAPFLVICPLGVKHQFQEEDGPALGIRWQYVRTDEEVRNADSPYLITNYERVRDGDICETISDFAGVSLDEGSVLRSLGSKTSDVFRSLFANTPYRFVATATPAPNEYREIIYYAEFLGIMDHGQALTRWFKRDPQKAGNLTIHPQHEKDFWMWVAGWALFLFTPSDLGYSDEGYDLPELQVHWHRVGVDHTRAWSQIDNRGQHRLTLDAAGGISEASQEKRATLDERISTMLEIMLQSQCTTSSIGGQDARGQRDEGGLQQGILPGASRRGEGALPGMVSCEQGEDRPRTEKSLYARVSENIQAQKEDAGGDCGAQPKASGTICQRSGISRADETSIKGSQPRQSREEKEWEIESDLRDNAGTIRDSLSQAGGSVRDLRGGCSGSDECGQEGSLPLCGSRSQNGRGEGDSLSSVQLWDRAFSGRPGVASEGCGLPDQWVIWCHLNYEQRALEKVFAERNVSTSSIYGALEIEETERRLYQWKRRETSVLLSKPVMLGAGLNLQQAHLNIFVGIDYKFQDFIQAIHRTHRFQQEHPVDVHIIYAESEDNVVNVLKAKWEQHNVLIAKMREIIRRYGLSHEAMHRDLKRSMGVKRVEVKGQLFMAVNNDCVDEVRLLADDSVGLIHTSIPFGNHYEYTEQVEDFGHNPKDSDFWTQMDYLIPELLRVLKPGRVAAIHVKDRQLYGHQTDSGMMEVAPFSDECVMAFRKHGFTYQGRRTIVTDVVRENASTYRLGWTEMTKDASKMSSGLPEYLLLFRKPPTSLANARADEPVTKAKADYTRARWQIDAHCFWQSDGNTPLLPHELYDYEAHVKRLEVLDSKGALPASFFYEPPVSKSEAVWDDVIFMRSLNAEQSRKRQENHICPLPFDIVERTIRLYSNPGDVVLDPFAGLFTVATVAVKLGRYGHGVELNSDYFANGVKYCQDAETLALMPTLFEYMEAAGVK